MKKITLNGKMIKEHNSSFVEFLIDSSISDEDVEDFKNEWVGNDEFSCYEAFWVGKNDGHNSVMICYDECSSDDFEVMKNILDYEAMDMVTEEGYNH